MKKISLFLAVLLLSSTACTSSYHKLVRLFKTNISIEDVLKEKERYDLSTNPAEKHLLLDDLQKNLVTVKNAVVKDIIPAINIDYKFSVVVSIPGEKGTIDCYIHTKTIYQKEDIKHIAQMKQGVTKINARGEFNRFITLLDDVYARIELINSDVEIIE